MLRAWSQGSAKADSAYNQGMPHLGSSGLRFLNNTPRMAVTIPAVTGFCAMRLDAAKK